MRSVIPSLSGESKKQNTNRFAAPGSERQRDQEQPAQLGPSPVTHRVDSLDWLRILAVLLVFFFHCKEIFDTMYRPGNQVTTFDGTRYLLDFVPIWVMGLFFILSGAGTCFALRTRPARHYLANRLSRVFVPLLVGVLLLAPQQEYFIQTSKGRFTGSLIEFYSFFFTHMRMDWSRLQWTGTYLHHLWFLAYLFAFSLLALPVFLAIKRLGSHGLIQKLTALCEKPGGFVVLFLPFVLLQIGLEPIFPGYQNWTYFLSWLWLFICGYLLISHERLMGAIKQQGWLALAVGSASVLLGVILSFAGVLQQWYDPHTWYPGFLLLHIFYSIAIGAWLMVALSFGSKWLNGGSKFLHFGDRIILPFFVVHYPVLVVVSFYVLPWAIAPLVKGLVLTSVSFVITLAIACLITRQLPLPHPAAETRD